MSTDAQSTTATQLLVQANVAHSLKVESRDGDQVGSVYALMVHKGTGRSTHAVLSLGGFLGMGKSFYPLPFELLQFDPVRDLYVVTIDRRIRSGLCRSRRQLLRREQRKPDDGVSGGPSRSTFAVAYESPLPGGGDLTGDRCVLRGARDDQVERTAFPALDFLEIVAVLQAQEEPVRHAEISRQSRIDRRIDIAASGNNRSQQRAIDPGSGRYLFERDRRSDQKILTQDVTRMDIVQPIFIRDGSPRSGHRPRLRLTSGR